MAVTQNEIDMVMELFDPLAPIKTRKMMGGLAIYAMDVTFALYSSDAVVYLKTDAENEGDFIAEGLEKFSFEMNGKTGSMNYYPMPERLYDDPEELEIWARKSLDVALRAKAKKKPRKKKAK